MPHEVTHRFVGRCPGGLPTRMCVWPLADICGLLLFFFGFARDRATLGRVLVFWFLGFCGSWLIEVGFGGWLMVACDG